MYHEVILNVVKLSGTSRFQILEWDKWDLGGLKFTWGLDESKDVYVVTWADYWLLYATLSSRTVVKC